MADLAQLEAALVKADAAGDADGARVLAGEVRKMRAAKPAAAEPSMFDKAQATVKLAADYSPAGFIANRAKEGFEKLDKAAYDSGGAVTDFAAQKLGASPEVAAGAGFATNLGVQSIPTLLGGGGAKVAAQPAVGEAARGMMQSALKPTLADLRTGKAAKAIDTMFEEGINVTKGGVAELRSKIAKLNEEIFDAIKNSPATVDKNKVASALLIPLKKFEMQVNPGADMQAIESAWTQFLQHPLLAGSDEIPVGLAQQMKQATYKSLGDKSYGELKGADIEAQKHLARGLKEEIATAVPEVGALNAQDSKLINALNVMERRTLMEANKNPMGLALLAKNPEAWAAFMADRSGLFKSLAARMLNANSGTLPVAAGAGAGGAVGATTGQQK